MIARPQGDVKGLRINRLFEALIEDSASSTLKSSIIPSELYTKIKNSWQGGVPLPSIKKIGNLIYDKFMPTKVREFITKVFLLYLNRWNILFFIQNFGLFYVAYVYLSIMPVIASIIFGCLVYIWFFLGEFARIIWEIEWYSILCGNFIDDTRLNCIESDLRVLSNYIATKTNGNENLHPLTLFYGYPLNIENTLSISVNSGLYTSDQSIQVHAGWENITFIKASIGEGDTACCDVVGGKLCAHQASSTLDSFKNNIRCFFESNIFKSILVNYQPRIDPEMIKASHFKSISLLPCKSESVLGELAWCKPSPINGEKVSLPNHSIILDEVSKSSSSPWSSNTVKGLFEQYGYVPKKIFKAQAYLHLQEFIFVILTVRDTYSVCSEVPSMISDNSDWWSDISSVYSRVTDSISADEQVLITTNEICSDERFDYNNPLNCTINKGELSVKDKGPSSHEDLGIYPSALNNDLLVFMNEGESSRVYGNYMTAMRDLMQEMDGGNIYMNKNLEEFRDVFTRFNSLKRSLFLHAEDHSDKFTKSLPNLAWNRNLYWVVSDYINIVNRVQIREYYHTDIVKVLHDIQEAGFNDITQLPRIYLSTCYPSNSESEAIRAEVQMWSSKLGVIKNNLSMVDEDLNTVWHHHKKTVDVISEDSVKQHIKTSPQIARNTGNLLCFGGIFIDELEEIYKSYYAYYKAISNMVEVYDRFSQNVNPPEAINLDPQEDNSSTPRPGP